VFGRAATVTPSSVRRRETMRKTRRSHLAELDRRIIAAAKAGDEQAIDDALTAASEFYPDRALSGEMTLAIAIVHLTYGDAVDDKRLVAALAQHSPSEILDGARFGLREDELYEWVLRAATGIVALYNAGLPEAEQLPDLIGSRDRLDFHAPLFLPDATNSLLLEPEDGSTKTPEELEAMAAGLTAELRASLGNDTAVIAYDHRLHMVGDAIRHLYDDDEEEES
jgi:hypothetical protein